MDSKPKPTVPTREMFAAAKVPRFSESLQIDLTELELETAFDRITNVPPPEPSTPSVSSLPTPKLPERDTERPEDTVQQALQYVSRTGIAFTQQPRWAYDAELDCVTLSESYLATAPDDRGNRFAIRCGAGLAVAVPENAMALSFLKTLELEFVKAQLRRDSAAMIFPFNGGPELYVTSVEWHAEIVSAFSRK